MPTLLEKAKATAVKDSRRELTPDFRERAELALAWVNGEVTPAQARAALGGTKDVSPIMVSVLASAIRAGLIHAEMNGNK